MPLSVRAALTPPIRADGAAPKENRAGDIPGLGRKHHAGCIGSYGDKPMANFLHGALNEAALGGWGPIPQLP